MSNLTEIPVGLLIDVYSTVTQGKSNRHGVNIAILENQLMGKPGRTARSIKYSIPRTPLAHRAICNHMVRGLCNFSQKKCTGQIRPHSDQIAAAQLQKVGFTRTKGDCLTCNRKVDIILMQKVSQPDKLNTGKLGKRASRG